MKIISTNIGEAKTVTWGKKTVKTGIFKYPVNRPLFLGNTDVKDDAVVDRKYHGGPDKACYIYSSDYYAQWKELFPELQWQYGMLGENLTVEGLDEHLFYIGDIYKIGDAIVQVSEPRQPCFKLNIRLNSKNAMKAFIQLGHSGSYLRVIQEGFVENGETFKLIERQENALSIHDVFQLIYGESIDSKLLEKAINDPWLAISTKEDLIRKRISK